MSDAAAIAAQVVDIQNDRQHKGFIKVTLHVPAECGQQLTAAMGWPTYTTPVPVAIARLNPETERKVVQAEIRETAKADADAGRSTQKSTSDTPPASGPDIQARARKVDPDKRIVQRVAILCTEPMFWRYLNETYRKQFPQAHVTDEAGAADLVRFLCDVKSRKEILSGTRAADKWQKIYDPFCVWRDVPELADAR